MQNRIKWTIDPAHSEITFKIEHLMIAHLRVYFKNYDAEIFTNGYDFTKADINVWIDPTSISTGDEKRDKHMRSAEFFDTEHHRQIVFDDSTIERSKNGSGLELWGNLTIKGISKRIMLNLKFGGMMKDPVTKKEKAGFTISGKINRHDWDMDWNTELENGGMLLGDEVEIECEVEIMRTTDEKMKLKEEEAFDSENIPAE